MSLTVPRGIIAVIRSKDPQFAQTACLGLLAAGVPGVELTLTAPNATELIAELAPAAGGRLGAGTVLTTQQARQCATAGAAYLVSPCTDLGVMKVAAAERIPAVPGAATPTEIYRAHLAGATAVKLFPISTLGGASFVRAVREPIPDPVIVVSGGVTTDQVGEMFAAGAHAVCLGGEIIDQQAASAGDVDSVADYARRVLAATGVAAVGS